MKNTWTLADGTKPEGHTRARTRLPTRSDPCFKVAYLKCVICWMRKPIADFRDRYQGCTHGHCINYDSVARECKKCEDERSNDILYAYLRQISRQVHSDMAGSKAIRHLDIPILFSIDELLEVLNEQKRLCARTGVELTYFQCGIDTSKCEEKHNAQIEVIDPTIGIVKGNFRLVASSVATKVVSAYAKVSELDTSSSSPNPSSSCTRESSVIRRRVDPRRAAAAVRPYPSVNKPKTSFDVDPVLAQKILDTRSVRFRSGSSLPIRREHTNTNHGELKGLDDEDSDTSGDDCIIIDRPERGLGEHDIKVTKKLNTKEIVSIPTVFCQSYKVVLHERFRSLSGSLRKTE